MKESINEITYAELLLVSSAAHYVAIKYMFVYYIIYTNVKY